MSRRALAVDADLTLAHRAGAIRIRSAGGWIDVDLPLDVWRARPSRRARRRGLGLLDRALAAGGLTARVRVLGLTILRLGADRHTTLLARIAGLAPEEPS